MRTTVDALPTSRGAIIATAAASALVVLAVYLLRLDRIAGLVVDDAWYVLLGKALADGGGFRLINSAASRILPVVPPGFPAILAGVFQIDPGFPHNVLWLKSVSIAAMMGVGVASGWYFLRWRHMSPALSIALATATVMTPAYVFLATSTVMADCVFTFGQMITLVLLERTVHATDGRVRRRAAIVTGLAAAATVLVRSTGAALVLTGLLYLVYARRWRSAIVFAAVSMVSLMPWTIYATLHAPTMAQRMEHGGSIAYAYGDSMQMRIPADPTSGRVTLRELPARLADNVINVCCRDVGGIVFPTFFRGAAESGQEVLSIGRLGVTAGSMGNAPATVAVSLVLSAMAVFGWITVARERLTAAEILGPISIAMIVIVPVWTFRYMLPLAPLLLFYLVKGLEAAASPRAARIGILCVIGFALSDHAQYILATRDPVRAGAIDWVADSREVDDVLAWMHQNLAREEGAVATTNPALVYLRTGRRTVALDDLSHNWRRWKTRGIRYLVCLRPADLPPSSQVDFKLLYQTSRRKLWVVEI